MKQETLRPSAIVTPAGGGRTRRFSLLSGGLVAAIGLLLAGRLALLGSFQLLPEEAYYWMFAKHPTACYIDHPPMVAALIAAGTFLFGDNEFGVRIICYLLAAASVGLCYVLGRYWGGRRAGLGAAGLFGIAPIYVGAGYLATPDTPLLFFWLLVLVAVTRATRGDRLAWWLLAGASAGLAFTSKYPGAMLIPSVLLFLLSGRRERRLLTRPGPWLALAVAAAVALPVIWWNYQHDWASFRFQFARRYGQHGAIGVGHTLAWLGGQFALMTPPIFALLAAALVVAVRRFRADRGGRWRFAACFAVPWLVVCFWHGLFSQVRPNWPPPAYLSLLPAGALLLRSGGLPVVRRLSHRGRRILMGLCLAATVALDAAALGYTALPPGSVPRPNIMRDWAELGRHVARAAEAMRQDRGREPIVLVIASKYQLASEIAFYARGPGWPDYDRIVPVAVLLGEGLSYNLWVRPEQFIGQDALVVGEEALTPHRYEAIESCFERTDPPEILLTQPMVVGGTPTFWMMRGYGFRAPSAPATRPG